MTTDGEKSAPENVGADAPGEGSSRGTLSSLIEEIIRGAAPGAGRAIVEMRSGDVVGRYELRREIGRGGFGVVWEARDRDLGRAVAIKVLRNPGMEQRERRLVSEAEVAARLSHPNIVTVLDVGRTEHGVYLVQEYLTGQTLSVRLRDGRLPLRETLRIGIEIARALAHAHAHGVVHRDLSAQNVFLCDDAQVKVLDLGMAAAVGRRKLEGGTPDYMPPEQAAGAPEDERTDVYALGVLLFRMITGSAPIAHDAAGRPRGRARGLDVPELPALALLVESMLSADPLERPRDANLVLAMLQECISSLPAQAVGQSNLARIRTPRTMRWWLGGLAVGIVVAMLAGLTLAFAIPSTRLGARGPLVIAAGTSTVPCAWRLDERFLFDVVMPGAQLRNGLYGEQKLTRRDERGIWLQTSDWNQLIAPIGKVHPDVFAIQAQFWMPTTDRVRDASLHVWSDPLGAIDSTSSNLAHGRGLLLQERPGSAPSFEWGIVDGMTTRKIEYQGTLGGTLTNQWHTVRMEGSRSGCWIRVSLDGQPLLAETGYCDYGGSNLVLGSATDSYTPSEIAWRGVDIWEGDPSCR